MENYKPLRIWRRQWLINNEVQLRMIVHSLSMGVFGALGVHFYYSHSHWIVLVLVGVVVVLSLGWGLWFSHRIVGPIFAIERQAKAIVKGEAQPPLHCRKGDYFHSTIDCLNQLLGHKGNSI